MMNKANEKLNNDNTYWLFSLSLTYIRSVLKKSRFEYVQGKM